MMQAGEQRHIWIHSWAVTAPWRLKTQDQGPHLEKGRTTDLIEKILIGVNIFFFFF